MSLEENKEIVRKLFDAANRQDVAAVETLCTPELAVEMQSPCLR